LTLSLSSCVTYCRICISLRLLVSLFRPVDFKGPDESFGQLFGNTEKATLLKEILPHLEIASEAQVDVFLQPRLPDPTKIYTGALISAIRNWDSIWIQLDEETDSLTRVSSEITMFYRNLKANEEDGLIYEVMLKEGRFVAAQQADEEDVIFYRAKITKEEKERVELLYVDYGNSAWVMKKDVYPLHSYFVKDHLMAFETMFKAR